MNELLQRVAMTVVDGVMAILPRPVPDRAVLERCKIISHRGEHDNVTILENTLPAYEQARAAGVWGIEADIRFTADRVPVICHDATTLRVFGQTLREVELDARQAPGSWELDFSMPWTEGRLWDFGTPASLLRFKREFRALCAVHHDEIKPEPCFQHRLA